MSDCWEICQWNDNENKLFYRNGVTFICFVLDQHTELDFYRNISPHRCSNQTDYLRFRVKQLLFLLFDAANTNFTALNLTRPAIEPTIYHIRGEQAYHIMFSSYFIFSCHYMIIALDLSVLSIWSEKGICRINRIEFMEADVYQDRQSIYSY